MNTDTIDSFIDLVKLNIASVNTSIRQLFDIIYRGQVPSEVQCYLSDTYLFFLYKDPDDPTKLRPIGIRHPPGSFRTTH